MPSITIVATTRSLVQSVRKEWRSMQYFTTDGGTHISATSRSSIINNSQTQGRRYSSTDKQHMISKTVNRSNSNVYDAEANNIPMSDQEQLRIKEKLSMNSGTEETHIQLVQNLQNLCDQLSRIQETYDNSSNNRNNYKKPKR